MTAAGPLAAVVGWMARNKVAANLLMLAVITGGLLTAATVRQETYPSFQLDIVDISVRYPGASPEEVEDGILLPIEESLRSLESAERVVSTAEEGSALISVELVDGADPNRALQEVNTAIDRISFFPELAERPTIGLQLETSNVIWFVLYGESERDMHDLAERVRRDLLAIPGITRVELPRGRTPEIRVEVSEATLRSLGLTLGGIATTIRGSARDLPAGGVRTPGGEYLLRSSERREVASAYADIPIVTGRAGGAVRLGDVARIRESFEDKAFESWFNGGHGVRISVGRAGEEKPLEIAAAVHRYLDTLRPTLPEGSGILIMRDSAAQYRARLELLMRNGLVGLVLVFLVLGLFLDPRLAFWIAAGIPTALLGAVFLLPVAGASINMISLFAFIVTLGILVDDSIVVGENIFHKIESGVPPSEAVVTGAKEMVVPIVFAVGTNIIAFVPLLFVPGETGRFFAPLPAVVIAVFAVSLIEALFILPAHLAIRSRVESAAAARKLPAVIERLARIPQRTSAWLERWVTGVFGPFLRSTLERRHLTLAAAAAVVAITWALVESGRVRYNFNPVIEGTRVDSELQTPTGAPFSETVRIAKHIEAAGLRAAARLGGGDPDSVLGGRMNTIGRKGENWADINFVLVEAGERDFDQVEFVRVWREEIGEVAGMESLYFEWEEGPSSGAGLTIEVSHPDRRSLEEAATSLAARMAEYRGVTDIKDGFASGKPQIDVELTEAGHSLGLTAEDVGRQVRHAFFGAEALRLQRGRHETRVMVRLPEEDRRSLAAVEDLRVRLPGGGDAPLTQVAQLRFGRAYTQIDRVDGRRVLNVTANIVPELANINQVRAALEADVLPALAGEHPGLEYGFSGRQREERRAMDELRTGLLISLALIFAFFAALFRSYAQAMVVMGAIPIALTAVVWGHVLLGHDLSVVSVFGMIALCGLVVNGGLVLTVEINERIRDGAALAEAVVSGTCRRFRPVVLSGVTTFAGVSPMILETDPQALFLVPMAIALGFGSVVSGLAVLVIVPCALLVLADIRAKLPWRRPLSPAPAESP